MTETIDLVKQTELLDKKDLECEQLGAICRSLLDRKDKDFIIIEEQAKKIANLKKNQDPKAIKAYLEVQARVLARKGIDDILTRMKPTQNI